nr:MAG TPA: hypothetical protein [Caudoviricetes sp.]
MVSWLIGGIDRTVDIWSSYQMSEKPMPLFCCSILMYWHRKRKA